MSTRRRSAGISWATVGLVAIGAVIGAVILVLAIGMPGGEEASAPGETPPATQAASAAGLTPPPSPEGASSTASAPATGQESQPAATAVATPLPTMPGLPTPAPTAQPGPTMPSRAEIEAAIREAAERFQKAKQDSQRSGDTSGLASALAGDALARQIALVNETKAAGCYWVITLDAPLEVEILELRDNNYARISVTKTESRAKYCGGALESQVTGDRYSAEYVVELIAGTWLVTERE